MPILAAWPEETIDVNLQERNRQGRANIPEPFSDKGLVWFGAWGFGGFGITKQ